MKPKRWICNCMADDPDECGDDQHQAGPCSCVCHTEGWEVEE